MTTITEYPQTARSRFPDFAHDLVTFREKACAEFPDLPRATWIVSRADIDSVRSAGKTQAPRRNASGERLKCICDRLAPGRADAYAKRHGWPFTVHISNLDAAEQIKPKLTMTDTNPNPNATGATQPEPPYTPAQVLANLREFHSQLSGFPLSHRGPGWVRGACREIAARGIADPERDALRDSLAKLVHCLAFHVEAQGNGVGCDAEYLREARALLTKGGAR